MAFYPRLRPYVLDNLVLVLARSRTDIFEKNTRLAGRLQPDNFGHGSVITGFNYGGCPSRDQKLTFFMGVINDRGDQLT